jgi:hypothetical protein
MHTSLFALVVTVCLAADEPTDSKPMRKPHPLAPSLPQLTADEEDKVDDIINRFMQYDIGTLRGAEGEKAKKEFDALQPEAIPALIRGLNRAAKLEHSCPATVIAKKLNGMLMASEDAKLLEFARDEIGAGVKNSQHAAVLAQLRNNCLRRKNALADIAASGGDKSSLRTVSTEDLIESANRLQGQKLRPVLIEVESRKGDEVLGALAVAATNSDPDIKQLARVLIERNLSRQAMDVVKEKLKDSNAEVRAAAARVAGIKWPGLFSTVIDLLDDLVADVREDAHRSLIRLSKGQDFGPDKDARPEEQSQAKDKWRDWLAKQKK